MFGLFFAVFISMLLKAKLYVSWPLSVLSQQTALSRLLAIWLGFFYRFRTKKTFSACLQLVTLMLAYFAQNNVIVCLQLDWVASSLILGNTIFLLFCCQALSFWEQRCFGYELRLLGLYSISKVFACFQLENTFFRFISLQTACF